MAANREEPEKYAICTETIPISSTNHHHKNEDKMTARLLTVYFTTIKTIIPIPCFCS